MIGSNELLLCEAEMMVAIQEYLDKRMGEYAPEVQSVDIVKGLFRILLAKKS